jgi:hypothetical protein
MNRFRPLLLVAIGAIAIVTAASAQTPPARNFVAHLSGDEEVPVRATLATGQAVFQYDAAANELRYRLIVANIDNVVASHIHLAPFGVNGPVVAFLAGPLAGQDLTVLIAALRTGGAYVNVHTNDGVDPTNTGAGDFPGGEIRGQIRGAGAAP